MLPIKVATASLNQTPLDWDGNQRRIESVLEQARDEGVGLLVLPELCVTGYGCEDAFLGPDVSRRAWAMLMALLPQTKRMAVSIGMPVRRRGGLYNTACVVADGRIAGFAAKEHLAGEGLHYEPRWFKPWPNNQVVHLEHDGQSYPFGDVFFDFSGVRVGFEICEDAWVAQRRGALDGYAMDIIVNPSASHFAFGKHAVRERLVLEGSRSMAVTYLYANLLGNEAGRVIYDGGCFIAQNGRMLAQSPRLTFDDFVLTAAVVDIEASQTEQVRTTSFMADRTDPGTKCINVSFELPRAVMKRSQPTVPEWETSKRHKEEEFMRAITLALFDYQRKSRSRGFVLSISGGVDSAAAACLVALMIERAIGELGGERFAEKVGLEAQPNPRDWVRELLWCAYQPPENSSEVTRSAATAVAKALGATFYVLDVQHIVEAYEALISDAIGRPLTWERDDITLQNIQARARGPSVWMLANIRGALLLSTSNRSEAAVGYATMDGDTCGGLSPIAGIDKAFLRHWLRWLETTGPTAMHPIPALHEVNTQTPTAELRPRDQEQTDEDDLMPYPVLDVIERLAIGDKLPPEDCLEILGNDFPEHDTDTLKEWVARFFRLWSRNQWKRERYAPSFHVDDKNLDPKTWCRFPILSGGFEQELSEL
ncbi:MAG: NAD+ synthetase [Myxococcales bacterium SG8_38]|nr:MAG: NAD+ synthetase [Myxococcales bacterium SG8_38]